MAVNLVMKRVDTSIMCTWCLCRENDAIHVLFGCSFSQTVWMSLGLQELTHNDRGDVLEKFQQIFSVYLTQKLAWIEIVCWNLWNQRNKWLWDKVPVSAFGIQ